MDSDPSVSETKDLLIEILARNEGIHFNQGIVALFRKAATARKPIMLALL
jgi:hypothetical protein